MRHGSFPRSSILVYGQANIYSMVQSNAISQVEALLENNRIEDAVDLANSLPSGQANSEEAETLQYIHQAIAFVLFSQTRFVEAAPHFLSGALDPRILVSYFPELSGPLFTDGEEAEVYDGVARRMPTEASIDDLIRNYSPHLHPSTREAPTALEIRRILREEAIAMIKSVLQDFKGKGNHKQQEVMDTSLAILFARSGDTLSLLSHLESTDSVSLAARLDIVNVIPLIPPDWPLRSLSSFLNRSFRQTLRVKHEGQIIKAICAGQNSEVFENSYLVLREQGAIIEEPDDDEGSGEPESFDEKGGLAEKIALHLQAQQQSVNVTDVHPDVMGGY